MYIKSILVIVALSGSIVNAQTFIVQEGTYSPIGLPDVTVRLTKKAEGVFDFEMHVLFKNIETSMNIDPGTGCLVKGAEFSVCPVYSGDDNNPNYEGIVVTIEGLQTLYLRW